MSVEFEFDPLRINQVLSNILDNAVKCTLEDSPIQITVEMRWDAVRVSVTDQGTGSLRQLNHGSGLGLGLLVCKGLIELHGGTLGVISKTGGGFTFYFDLPLNSHSPIIAAI